MFTSAQMEACSLSLALLLSTKSASHLLFHLPAPRPLCSSREPGQRIFSLLHDAVGKSKTAVLIYPGEKVKQPQGHLCPLYSF